MVDMMTSGKSDTSGAVCMSPMTPQQRNMILIVGIVGVFALAGLLWLIVAMAGRGGRTGGSADSQPTVSTEKAILTAKVSKIRNDNVKGPQGRTIRKAYIDWENTGNRPVREVVADVIFLDKQGRELLQLDNWIIYTTDNSKPGVKPGYTHIASEADGEGVIVPLEIVRTDYRVEVRITRVRERSE